LVPSLLIWFTVITLPTGERNEPTLGDGRPGFDIGLDGPGCNPLLPIQRREGDTFSDGLARRKRG
jgi:hypothetical protein